MLPSVLRSLALLFLLQQRILPGQRDINAAKQIRKYRKSIARMHCCIVLVQKSALPFAG